MMPRHRGTLPTARALAFRLVLAALIDNGRSRLGLVAAGGGHRRASSTLGSAPIRVPWPRSDLDGNGTADTLWQNQRDGSLYAWFMDGAARIATGYLTPSAVPPGWQVGALIDLNAHGKPDILWHNQKDGALYGWYMDRLFRKAPSTSTRRRFRPSGRSGNSRSGVESETTSAPAPVDG